MADVIDQSTLRLVDQPLDRSDVDFAQLRRELNDVLQEDAARPIPKSQAMKPAEVWDDVNLRLLRLGFSAISIDDSNNISLHEQVLALLLEMLPEYERRGILISRLVQKLGNLHNKYDVVERLWKEQTLHWRAADAEEIKRLQNRLKEERAEVERINTQLQTSQEQAEVALDQVHHLQKQLQSIDETKSNLETEVANLRENIAQSEDLKQRLETENATLRTELSEAQAKKLAANEKKNSLRAELEQLRNELTELQATRSSPEVESLRREVSGLRAQLHSSVSKEPVSDTQEQGSGEKDRRDHNRSITKELCQKLNVSSTSHLPRAVDDIISEQQHLKTSLSQLHNIINATSLLLPSAPLTSSRRNTRTDDTETAANSLIGWSSLLVKLYQEHETWQRTRQLLWTKLGGDETVLKTFTDDDLVQLMDSSRRRQSAASSVLREPIPLTSNSSAAAQLDLPYRELIQHFRTLFQVSSHGTDIIHAAINELYIQQVELNALLNVARRVLALDPNTSVLRVIEKLQRRVNA